MTPSWFIYSNDVVTGPFSTEAVRLKLSSGVFPAGSFIWWKGQREWIPIASWESQVDQIVVAANDQAQKPVWYIDNGSGSPQGPLTMVDLIENLRAIPHLNGIRLWSVGMQNWKSLFEFGEVMEALGISRRQNPRAPLMGTVAVNKVGEEPKGYILKTASISVGGMGLVGDHDLKRGDQISVLIKSAEFFGGIHAKGEVAYVTSNNYVGIRFERLHAETLSVIVDYVKRFNSDNGNAKGSKAA